MKLETTLFRPPFERTPRNETRDAEQRDDSAAIRTYRYLRLGMIVIVFALLASVLFVHRTASCWQGSISAYYYTPARPIFVSALIAISVVLIVIKGSTVIEDLLLSVAGMLGPIVAFVPTSFEPACVPKERLGHGPGGLTDAIIRDAQNNILALMVAGSAALVLGVVVFVAEKRTDGLSIADRVGHLVLLAGTAVAVAIGWWLLATDRILDLHGWSAAAMFACLGLASIANGLWLWWINRDAERTTSAHWREFAIMYISVGALMGIAGAVIKFGFSDPWDQRTLVLEITEIGLFAGMWAIQSVERWGKILQAPAAAGTQLKRRRTA